jgi:hypothetical protein
MSELVRILTAALGLRNGRGAAGRRGTADIRIGPTAGIADWDDESGSMPWVRREPVDLLESDGDRRVKSLRRGGHDSRFRPFCTAFRSDGSDGVT